MGFPDRTATVARHTNETKVSVRINLDGTGTYENDTGIGFLNHMLDLFARHGRFDVAVTCNGDLEVDDHHTAEDVGITLGQAFAQALGEKHHINRFGHAYVPMDEALARAVVDLSGRFHLVFAATFDRPTVGDLSTEMVQHFWSSFAEQVRCNLHLELCYGTNAHHKVEALFKAAARALRMAVARHEANDRVASTKGTL